MRQLVLTAVLLVAWPAAATADPYVRELPHGGFYFGPPGYNPYNYPYPDRDGDAIFDINCRDGIQILKLEGFRVIDIVRCKMRQPFVYIAVSEGRRYRVRVSTLDGEILSVEPVDNGGKRKTRRQRKKKRN